MTIDLTSLSVRELNQLIRTAEQTRKALVSRPPAEKVRKQLTALARKAGYTIEEVFGVGMDGGAAPRTRRRKLPKVAIKYRDPENRRYTWTGRGKMPRWLASKVRFGQDPVDFLVPGVAKLTPKAAPANPKRKLFKQG